MHGWWFVDALLLVLCACFLVAAFRRGLIWTVVVTIASIVLLLINTSMWLGLGTLCVKAGLLSQRSAAGETLLIMCFMPFCFVASLNAASGITTRLRPKRHRRRGYRRQPARPAWPSRCAAAMAAPCGCVIFLVAATTITSLTLQGTLVESPVKSTILNYTHQASPTPVVRAAEHFFTPAPPPMQPEPIIAMRPGQAGSQAPPTLQPTQLEPIVRHRKSIVKVTGRATGCDSGVSASGFVIAPQRVITNAHAIVKVPNVRIQPGGTGPRHKAQVVYFDPAADLAVLHVPTLKSAPMKLANTPKHNSTSAVVGYPKGGNFTVSPARLTTEQVMWATNIQTRREHLRHAMVLDANIRPGNSGGPALNAQGNVTGIVFARDRNNPHLGFATHVNQWKHLTTKPLKPTTQHLQAPCSADINKPTP